MAVKSTICGIMHYARQCSNAFGRNHKSQINPFKSEFFSTHVVMKYMAGDANLTVCKNFFYYFVSVGRDIFVPQGFFCRSRCRTHMYH